MYFYRTLWWYNTFHTLGCVNLSFAYVEGESLLMALKDVALSSGRSVITQILRKLLKMFFFSHFDYFVKVVTCYFN